MEFPGSKKWFENKKLEQKRNPEVFRASIGFDFIFHYDESGEIKCKCLELNGHNTGVFGVSEIKDGKFDKLKKILSSIRAQYSDEALRDNQYMREMAENRKIGWYPYDKRFHDRVNRYIAGSKYKRKIIKHSYTAPRNLEMIFGDKVLLPDLIPEEYRIRQFSISELSAQPFVLPKDISSDDILIFKPALGIQGKGIGFSTAEEFQDVMNSNDEFRHAILVKYVVQKFIKSKGANRYAEQLNQQAKGNYQLGLQGALETVGNAGQKLTDYRANVAQQRILGSILQTNDFQMGDAKELITKAQSGEKLTLDDFIQLANSKGKDVNTATQMFLEYKKKILQ